MATEAARTDVQAFIDRHPFSWMQWIVFVLCFATILLDGFDTAAIGYVAPSLLKEWNIAKPALSPVLTSALFGLVVGSLSSGMLADFLGRRTVLAAAATTMGVFCLLSSRAGSLDELIVLRFLTGLGLGAAMPNAITMMSEFCPSKRRALLTNGAFCGFPVGASLGGFLAAWMIPQWGWRSVLALGGTVPVILAILVVLLMPESVYFLLNRGRDVRRVVDILRRISPDAGRAGSFFLAERSRAFRGQRAVGVILSRHYLLGTVALWVTYFMGLVIFYGVINWLPVLLKDIGIAPKQAIVITALFSLGGLGALLSGWLMDRFHADLIVAALYGMTAIGIFAVSTAIGSAVMLPALILLAGGLMNTGQSSLGALAARFYPTEGRATGVSWMTGVGRFGGIAGTFLVGSLQGYGASLGTIMNVLAVAGLIAAAALLLKHRVYAAADADIAAVGAPGDSLSS
ncbi:MAG TPA: MFS transporter [Burkholderiaceae bacterium]|nr:MFS transporter [Burkholderiaceae bacterium]